MEIEQAFALIVALKLAKKRKFRKRECWVRKWVDRLIKFGACSTLVGELKLEDAQQFRNFIRMSAVQFESLLDLVKHQIVKKDTKFRASLKSLRDSKSLPVLTEDWRPSRESKKSHFHL
ncbi:protein Hydra magnipapillata [Nesidiocoris tenuis]|uniref:Protein Hydra magnipapillata n=1 Tax=Nesidiocoris tenuis TaxID=355587 RepID=A0ABN7ATV7_9HEMI|nr:protein Hydra magnipapillata [Nesidiocoris tenuis]